MKRVSPILRQSVGPRCGGRDHIPSSQLAHVLSLSLGFLQKFPAEGASQNHGEGSLTSCNAILIPEFLSRKSFAAVTSRDERATGDILKIYSDGKYTL